MGAELADAVLTARDLAPALRSLGGGGAAAMPVTAPAAGVDDVEAVAAREGVRARAVSMAPATLDSSLSRAGRLLLDLGAQGYLLVLESAARHLTVRGRDGQRIRLPVALVSDALRERVQQQAGADGGARPQLSRRVEALLAAEEARHVPLTVGWLLESGVASATTAASVLDRPVALRAAAVVGCHLGQFAFWVMSWVVLGTIIVASGISERWLAVWVLCLAGMLVLKLATRWLSGALTLELGTRVKQGVLTALLNLSADDARRIGLGRMIATSVDANRLDMLAVNGAVTTVLGSLELLVLFVLLLLLPAPLLGSLLALFVFGMCWLAARFLRAHAAWHGANLDVTAVHTEEMVGHRARKTLLGMLSWYRAEDDALARYSAAAAKEDRVRLLFVLAPRVWLVLGAGLVILAGNLAAGFADVRLIAALGLVLLGYASLQRATIGLTHLLAAVVSFRHLTDVLGLHRGPSASSPDSALESGVDPYASAAEAPKLVARDLEFCYPDAAAPVLAGASFAMAAKDRFVLEGPSGGGKSTLARVLSGRLEASHGSVLLGGLDVHVLGGDVWRRNVCYVPQFHNNHVLTETFLFNLLLGCSWPPTREDMLRVQQVLDAVGLMPLVERMPAGLMQMVGESGWRLSQGEQARLFVARGMLQAPRLLIVDEPLSALDTATAGEVLDALSALDCMLVLITHR